MPEDPEKLRERRKRWYATHREQVQAYQLPRRGQKRAYDAERYAARSEERKAQARGYYWANREKVCMYQQAYNASHHDEIQAYRLAYSDRRRAYASAYQAAHPEKKRESEHRRRTEKRGGFVGPVDADVVYRRDRGRCHVCGKKVGDADASLDHLLPLSRGGAHAPWNVRLAHRQCNFRRYNNGPAQLLLTL